MATPADLIAAAGAAGAAPRRPVAPRPMTATVGSAPGGVATLDAGGPSTGMLDTLKTAPPPAGPGGFPGFRPMGGGMPAPPPQMAQGREVVEQDGQQGVMGAGGRFQPLGDAALGRLGGGGPLRTSGTFGGGSGGIVAEEDGGGGLPGFRSMGPNPYGRPTGRTDVGGGKLRALQADGDMRQVLSDQGALGGSTSVSGSGEIQGDGARGMSSIGAAVGRTMRPRSMRSAVSREGAAPGY